MKGIYDVTAAVVDDTETVLALFDPREGYGSITIIRPAQRPDGSLYLVEHSPDTAEWVYWHEKFGIISIEDFNTRVAKMSRRLDREKLYYLLKTELNKPTERMLADRLAQAEQQIAILEEERRQAHLDNQS